MIEFFRDVLDGPLYIAITVLSIIFIMAIIGFLMERKKLEKEAKSKIAVISNTEDVVTPIEPVSIQAEMEIPPAATVEQTQTANDSNPISNLVSQDAPVSNEVQTPIIIFEDPDQKKE